MVERAPDHRALNYHYAQVLTKLGRGNESRQYLERSLAAEPTFGPAVMQLLDIYQQQNDWTKAAEILQPLIDEEPANIELLRQQAYFYLRGGEARKARVRFRGLLTADPKDSKVKFLLAESLNDLEEYAESEKLYRELLVETPDDPEVLGSFGLSLVGRKKWDEAAATFNKLLGRGDIPDHLGALARTQLANIDFQRGNYDAALETAKSIFVFRDRPNTQAINIALQALKKQNRTAEAIALLQPLADKFTSDPFVNARYVEALVRAGQKRSSARATRSRPPRRTLRPAITRRPSPCSRAPSRRSRKRSICSSSSGRCRSAPATRRAPRRRSSPSSTRTRATRRR
jgi:predicted Zn-dependent protease